MKKIISFLLTVSILSSLCITTFAAPTYAVPVYSSVEEWLSAEDNSPHIRIQSPSRSGTDYVDYVLVETKTYNDQRIGYHPDFNDWQYSNGYYFSSTKKQTLSASIKVEYKSLKVTLQVAASAGGSSGFFRYADGSRESRPWVRADLTVKTYDIYGYDGFGNQVSYVPKGYSDVTSVSDIEIFIDYR